MRGFLLGCFRIIRLLLISEVGSPGFSLNRNLTSFVILLFLCKIIANVCLTFRKLRHAFSSVIHQFTILGFLFSEIMLFSLKNDLFFSV